MMTEHPAMTESAPSRVRSDEPTIARWVGGIGWGIILVGVAIVAANRSTETPRLFTEGWGWLFILAGTTMAMIHASLETDLLLRRLLGGVGVALIVAGIGWGTAMAVKDRSWALGLVTALPGVFLCGLYLRREDDPSIRRPCLWTLGGAGLLLAAVGVLATLIKPEWMPARWSVMMVIGLILTLMYRGFAGAADEWADRSVTFLGILGGGAFACALVRSVGADVLYEWRNPSDTEHLVAFALGASLLVLGFVAIFVLGKPAAAASGDSAAASGDSAAGTRKWGRVGAIAGVLLIVLGALRYFAPNLLANLSWGSEPPRPYLVPTGVVLMTVGLVYGLVALWYSSDNPLVVLTRKELTTYFVSPIAYCVMAGFVLMAAQAYHQFLRPLVFAGENQYAIEEPIIQNYVINFPQVVALMVAVPLVTMRLFSEEKRTGTLEVLLTAPVSDWLVVLSKFLAVWMFFIILWLPWWLLVLALRLEGGQEFDVRPMIGFLLALAACGASFTAMGMFFSSLTRDQIISAALTFMGMMFLVGFYFLQRDLRGTDEITTAVKSITKGMSFIHMWIDATEGKLYIRDVVYQLCAAVFWLFATVKVLEFRRWS